MYSISARADSNAMSKDVYSFTNAFRRAASLFFASLLVFLWRGGVLPGALNMMNVGHASELETTERAQVMIGEFNCPVPDRHLGCTYIGEYGLSRK